MPWIVIDICPLILRICTGWDWVFVDSHTFGFFGKPASEVEIDTSQTRSFCFCFLWRPTFTHELSEPCIVWWTRRRNPMDLHGSWICFWMSHYFGLSYFGFHSLLTCTSLQAGVLIPVTAKVYQGVHLTAICVWIAWQCLQRFHLCKITDDGEWQTWHLLSLMSLTGYLVIGWAIHICFHFN